MQNPIYPLIYRLTNIMENDIMVQQKLDSLFRREGDRLNNANRKNLKGPARALYLGGFVKLERANSLVDSGIGLARMRVKKGIENESKK